MVLCRDGVTVTFKDMPFNDSPDIFKKTLQVEFDNILDSHSLNLRPVLIKETPDSIIFAPKAAAFFFTKYLVIFWNMIRLSLKILCIKKRYR
jgi:hypothetical protein